MYYWLCVLLYTVLAAMKGTQYNVLLVVCTGIYCYILYWGTLL